jgi:GTP-binding protein Era
MKHKAGFVNIIGNPNVGKSTLMNGMVGEKLSIITSKMQTTRHRILGILNGEDYQVVFSDTPGIIRPAYKLQESMMKFVGTALSDADIILYVTDVYENPEEIEIVNTIKAMDTPVLLLINKIDLSNQDNVNQLIEKWNGVLPKAEIFAISALHGHNLQGIFDRIIELLPESPPYYAKDALTDKPERFFVSEIIREKILMNYKKEVPYSVEIEVDSFKEKEDIIRIRSIVYVSRDSQKGILIGKQGQALKKTGTMAREEMEKFFGKKIFLELHVKVLKDWRGNENYLKKFGYN